jgi:hypothetical protein
MITRTNIEKPYQEGAHGRKIMNLSRKGTLT